MKEEGRWTNSAPGVRIAVGRVSVVIAVAVITAIVTGGRAPAPLF